MSSSAGHSLVCTPGIVGEYAHLMGTSSETTQNVTHHVEPLARHACGAFAAVSVSTKYVFNCVFTVGGGLFAFSFFFSFSHRTLLHGVCTVRRVLRQFHILSCHVRWGGGGNLVSFGGIGRVSGETFFHGLEYLFYSIAHLQL